MAQSNQSTAAILRVKGVSFNYLQFLWQQLALISQARQQGNYPVALKLCSELIVWLPRSLKGIFMQRALNIQENLGLIRSNSLPQLSKIVDIHQREGKRNWLMNAYSSAALSKFINDLTTKLDEMGYMENTKTVTEGETDSTEGTWEEQYKNAEDKGKHKDKKSKTPQGSMD